MNNLVNENLHLQLMPDFEIDYSNDNDKTIVDLVTVMGAIYCADVSIKARKRKLSVEIPVFQIEVWESLTEKIKHLLKWVSSEDYQISFRLFNENLIVRKERQLKLYLDSQINVLLVYFQVD